MYSGSEMQKRELEESKLTIKKLKHDKQNLIRINKNLDKRFMDIQAKLLKFEANLEVNLKQQEMDKTNIQGLQNIIESNEIANFAKTQKLKQNSKKAQEVKILKDKLSIMQAQLLEEQQQNQMFQTEIDNIEEEVSVLHAELKKNES